MNWMDKMIQGVDYIEEHILEEIDYEQIGKSIGCSAYLYQRMFSFTFNLTPAEYIRKRRMSLAAEDLRYNDMKIIDCALMYGYDSPTAFTRAFKSFHGLSPSQVRTSKAPMKSFSRFGIQSQIIGGDDLLYRIEKRASFQLIGQKTVLSTVGSIQDNQNNVASLWSKTFQDGSFSALLHRCDEPYHMGAYGVGMNYQSKANTIDYYIAIVSEQGVPDHLDSCIIPAQTWAVFPCIGPMPTSIQKMWQRINSEWVNSSGYEICNGPQMEWYPEGSSFASDYISEIWLPIRKKD